MPGWRLVSSPRAQSKSAGPAINIELTVIARPTKHVPLLERPPLWSRTTKGNFYFEHEAGQRCAVKLLSKDEARRIAVNIAKLPEPVHRASGAPWVR